MSLPLPHTHTPYYPPFGSSLPNRSWNDGNRGYRFGFNGKEKDSETASDNYDFGARIYDGRLGRWLSLDPLMKEFVGFSAYNFGLNNPVYFIDPDGKKIKEPTKEFKNSPYYSVYKSLKSNNAIYRGLIKKYNTDEELFNITFDYKNMKTTAQASTTSEQRYKVDKITGKPIVTANEAYSVYLPSNTLISNELVEDNKTFIVTKKATNIYMATLLFHEALHLEIRTNQSIITNPDDNHDYFAKQRCKIYNGLVEYSRENNLGFSDIQIEHMSWIGLTESNAFKKYITDFSTSNNTTFEEEYAKWYNSVEELKYTVTKVEKNDSTQPQNENTEQDSTIKKD